MGLGLNGGGEACVRFFLRYGAYVTVTDMKTQEQLAPTIEKLTADPTVDQSRLTYILGGHRIQDFSEADCVIKNPGVKFEGNKYLAAAKAVETDISIFLHFTKSPIIAVTGSKGKSSTVSAIDFGLRGAGFKTFLGGNITVSPLSFLEKTDGTTPVVLELSSWQLRDLRGRHALKPKIAVITKIVPDHQNFYGDMDSYVADKRLIYADQGPEDYTVLDYDEDDYLKDSLSPKPGCKCWGDLFASETKGTVMRYSKSLLPKDVAGVYQTREMRTTFGWAHLEPDSEPEQIMGTLAVPGEHNKVNVLNAALVMRLMNVASGQISSIVGEWKGISHRLERFHEWQSPISAVHVSFYNDSCATVPEAAAAASQAFGREAILISGGTDKNLDFTPLAVTLAMENGARYRTKQVYLLAGTGTDKLVPLLNEHMVPFLGPFESLEVLLGVLKANLMAPRAERIYDNFREDDPIPIVFSPGATSFGMFTNEFDRGNKFKDAVKQIFS